MPTLKNKPLVEAILEVRWALRPLAFGSPLGGSEVPATDPHQQLLLGRFFDRVRTEYPHVEELPAASFPPGMTPYVAHHRFRKSADGWPLLQLGPGLLTINDTAGYKWSSFRDKAEAAVESLFTAHPRPADLGVNHLILRYIDAIETPEQATNVLEFLSDKLKITVTLPDKLFTGHGIQSAPSVFAFESSFVTPNPTGHITLRIGKGRKDNVPAVIMETIFESRGDQVPSMPAGFSDWANAAHQITRDWFFILIEGELHERFQPVV